MTTKRACLLMVVALVAADVIGTLISSVLPSWVGGLTIGAIFGVTVVFFIYPRWKNDRRKE